MKLQASLPQYLCLVLLTLAPILAAPESASAATEQTLHNFNPTQAGTLPDGGVIADAVGNLYGVAANGGTFGAAQSSSFLPMIRVDGILKLSITSRPATTVVIPKAASSSTPPEICTA